MFEEVVYMLICCLRPVVSGGLGLTSVKQKSTSFLIKTFVELSANPKYISSQYLTRLYNFNILGHDIPCPPSPPYYNESFYCTIREAKEAGMDIINLSTKQWYNHLMNQEIFTKKDDDGSLVPNLSRSETLCPDIDWEVIWMRIRHPSFSSDTVSFLWKLVNELLPTEERLNATIGKS